MNQPTNNAMTGELTDDSWGTADVTTVEDSSEAWSTETEAMEPVDMATVTSTTPDTGKTARTTETTDAECTPEDHAVIGKMAWGTTVARIEDQITVIMMSEEAGSMDQRVSGLS